MSAPRRAKIARRRVVERCFMLIDSTIVLLTVQSSESATILTVARLCYNGVYRMAGGAARVSLDWERGTIMRTWAKYVVAALLIVPLFGVGATGTSAQVGDKVFPETGQSVKGLFLSYWQRNGGLAQQGYPISGEMQERSPVDGKTYRVQYFERSVFEHHPEYAGKSSEVLLSLLGRMRYEQKYPAGAPGQVPNTSAGSVLFKETGKRLG